MMHDHNRTTRLCMFCVKLSVDSQRGLHTLPTETLDVNQFDLFDRPCVLPGRRTHNVADAFIFFFIISYHTRREKAEAYVRGRMRRVAWRAFGFDFFW